MKTDLRSLCLLAAAGTAFLLAGSCSEPAPPAPPAPRPEIVVPASEEWWPEYRGRRVVLVGDSLTQGWQELGTAFDQEAYLTALGSRGINAVLIWSYIAEGWPRWDSRIGYSATAIWPWERTDSGFDLRKFNEAYFGRLREFVSLAEARDIVVILTVHDGWPKTRFSGHPFSADNGGTLDKQKHYVELARYSVEMPPRFDPAWNLVEQHQYHLERFCDRLIESVADKPNVMLEVLNEGEWYDQDDAARFQRHFVEFIARRTELPVIVNDDHVRKDFRNDVDVDAISLHRPLWTAGTTAEEAYVHFAAKRSGAAPKPYLFTEPVPEFQGEESELPAVMRLMWGTIMGGAGGFVMQNDTSFGFDPNTSMADSAEARDRVYDLEGHLCRFFNQSGIGFAAMRVNTTLSPEGLALENPGVEYVVYSQFGNHVEVDLQGAEDSLRARFYDPRTGQFQPEFEVQPAGASTSVAKPDERDWVLHLTRHGADKTESPQPEQ